MSSPHRCNHNRIHRDSTGIGQDNECTVPSVFSTPAPSTRRVQSSQAPKRRGRLRKQVDSPPSGPFNFDNDDELPSSPLGHFSKQPPQSIGSLGSPATPQETQEELRGMPDHESFVISPGSSFGAHDPPAAPFENALQHTPGGTSFIPETPVIVVTAPAAGPEENTGMLADVQDPSSSPQQERSPQPDAQPDVDQHDSIQYELEIDHLRGHLATVREDLADSTALVNRLRVRRRILEATAMVTNVLLGQTQRDRDAAGEDAREARLQTERVKRRMGSLLAFVLMVIVAYMLWCQYNSPEMEYIRQRREAVLFE